MNPLDKLKAAKFFNYQDALRETAQEASLTDILALDEPFRTQVLRILKEGEVDRTFFIASASGKEVTVRYGIEGTKDFRAYKVKKPMTLSRLSVLVYLLDFYGPNSDNPLIKEVNDPDAQYEDTGKKGKK